MSQSSLHESQRRQGAVFADAAATGALHFGDPTAEYRGATTSAALFDFSHHACIEVTGKDRAKFLHGFCTNDVKRLSIGDGCEAFVTNVKGKIVGHVWIVATEYSLWLHPLIANVENLVAHLERYVINEDVQIADRTQEFGGLLVLGPFAAERIEALGARVSGLANLQGCSNETLGSPIHVRRFDVGPIPGYAIRIGRDILTRLWVRLIESDVRPAGSQVWTALRIEAGLPVYGVDLTNDNLAQEAGRTQTAISFTKGCYLGQEPIARIDAMGHVNRELRSLQVAGDAIPMAGDEVVSDQVSSQNLGAVTSGAFSYGRQAGVGMAMLRSKFANPGSAVFVESDGRMHSASVFWPAG
jgi:hypothetical protein